MGVAQVFIRFFGCSLACKICDTPYAKAPSGDFTEYTAGELLSEVRRLLSGIHSVSLSGGEPLEQADFLKEFLPLLKKQKTHTYLETNGVLPGELKKVLRFIDIISMDIKLPTATGQKPFWREHEKFLKAAQAKDVFIKTIITLDTDFDEIARAAKLASKVNRGIVFILQPNHFELSQQLLLGCQKAQMIARKYLNDVRIIPQVHKLLGIR